MGGRSPRQNEQGLARRGQQRKYASQVHGMIFPALSRRFRQAQGPCRARARLGELDLELVHGHDVVGFFEDIPLRVEKRGADGLSRTFAGHAHGKLGGTGRNPENIITRRMDESNPLGLPEDVYGV